MLIIAAYNFLSNSYSIMLMDQGFQITTGLAQTGLKTGLVISNLSRQMLVKTWTRSKAQEWVANIGMAMNSSTGYLLYLTPFKKFNFFKSFDLLF